MERTKKNKKYNKDKKILSLINKAILDGFNNE
jgi:hypothetical protein